MDTEEWYTGDFEIDWTGESPLGVWQAITGQPDSHVCDLKLSDGGVLSLRVKENGEVFYCAPHTWASIKVAPPKPQKKGAPRRIR